MKIRFSLVPAFAVGVCVMFGGCKSYEGDFVPKTEKELEAMDERNRIAHEYFLADDYRGAAAVLAELTSERTVSSPLFELEKVSLLLAQGKDQEAHELMMRLQDEFETLSDAELEVKAQSLWHGEQNKVFRGDSHERATLYAFLAMSFMRQGNYEDALRCVKNGLLADGDAAKAEYTSDYALLQYLGALCSGKLNQPADAAAYRREMIQSLRQRGIPLPEDGATAETSFAMLDDTAPNVLLVLWAGTPPTFERGGEYGEIRHPIPGAHPFDQLVVAVSSGGAMVLPAKLGDVNFQALTRGGRLMDTVLADKAAVKKAAEISRNIFLIAGSGLIIGGVSAVQGDAIVGLTLLGSGVACLAIGGTIHVVGAMMNPTADVRFWRNLPYELVLVPLRLPAGRHDVVTAGYVQSDVVDRGLFSIDVQGGDGMNVIHLPMMKRGEGGRAAVSGIHSALGKQAVSAANDNPMIREISIRQETAQ